MKVKIGIIGCGHWGPNFIRNFGQLNQAEVKTICDLDEAKLKHLSASYPEIKTEGDYQRILDDREIDAVVIATPSSTHYDIAKAALAKDKHVLVEKPITSEPEQAQELISSSAKGARVLMVGHTFLHNSIVTRIKEIIDSRELGDIYYIHSRRTNLGPLRKDVNAIWDLSPHDISIINYWLGSMPREVSAYSQKFLAHNLADVGFVILKYPRDVLAHVHVSWLDPKKIRETTIIGSKKMLVYNDIDAKEPIKIYDKSVMKESYDKEYTTFEEFQMIIKDGKEDVPEVSLGEPLKQECLHFVNSIVNKVKPLTDGQNGLEVLEVLEAIDKSIGKNGEFIKL